jgi:hypothetical protein
MKEDPATVSIFLRHIYTLYKHRNIVPTFLEGQSLREKFPRR